jgi:hypothetical protein
MADINDLTKKLEVEVAKEKILRAAQKEAEEKSLANVDMELRLNREQLKENTKILEEAKTETIKLRKEELQMEEDRRDLKLRQQRELNRE